MAKSSVEYIYGLNPCFEVIRGGKRKIFKLYVGEKNLNNPRIKKLISFAQTKKIEYEQVTKERLHQLSKTTEHQGVVLKTSLYKYCELETVLEGEKVLLLDNVEDPHNVGAILRSAEILGFHSILLPVKGVPEVYPSVVKVSAGASEHLNIVKESASNVYLRKLQENHGYTVIALDGKGTHSLEEVKNANLKKILLVVGGEDKSVGQFILNKADFVVSIKQFGKINSLNASVAASVAMFVLGGKQ
ncbi:MAG: 23S rRNA (guanosine(2251)-2'-O)-methyltransferase RlmB [bacterium]